MLRYNSGKYVNGRMGSFYEGDNGDCFSKLTEVHLQVSMKNGAISHHLEANEVLNSGHKNESLKLLFNINLGEAEISKRKLNAKTLVVRIDGKYKFHHLLVPADSNLFASLETIKKTSR